MLATEQLLNTAIAELHGIALERPAGVDELHARALRAPVSMR